MKIEADGRDKRTGLTRYLIDVPYRRPDGKATHLHRVALGSDNLAATIGEIQSIAAQGSSLTFKFADGVDVTRKENNAAGMPWIYDRVKKDLGKWPVNDRFPARYHEYVDRLREEEKSPNVIANHKSVIRHILRCMKARGMIRNIPIDDFGIHLVFRSRIWTIAERNKLYTVMTKSNSHLYWGVYFAERNPIREGDQWGLTREDLIEVGPNAPYVRFQPRKTAKRKPRQTTLPEIDQPLLDYWHWLFKTFPDCDRLFPRIHYCKGAPVSWHAMGDPKTHWGWLRREAGIDDFHYHDLRHVAITGMLRADYTREQLKKLGIQYTDDAIDVYDQTTADDVLAQRRRSTFVAPGVGDLGPKLLIANGESAV